MNADEMTTASQQHDQIIEFAWREWRTNASLLGASPDSFELKVPRWFIDEELGFKAGEGPDLRQTCNFLARHNRDALLALGEEAPLRVTYPRGFERPAPRPIASAHKAAA